MRFKRHENGARDHFHVYADGADPITEITGVGGYTGEVFPCTGATVPRPVCAGPDGKECGKWHGYTHTVQHPRHPEYNAWGCETREEAAHALLGQRWEWADEIKRARLSGK